MNSKKEYALIERMMNGQYTTDDDGWKTINGTHVLIEGGSITKGPERLRNLGKSSGGSKSSSGSSKSSGGSKSSSGSESSGSKKPASKYAPGSSHSDKGVDFKIDNKGNRVSEWSGLDEYQVDTNKDGSFTIWSIRNGERVESEVAKGANLDRASAAFKKKYGLGDASAKFS